MFICFLAFVTGRAERVKSLPGRTGLEVAGHQAGNKRPRHRQIVVDAEHVEAGHFGKGGFKALVAGVAMIDAGGGFRDAGGRRMNGGFAADVLVTRFAHKTNA